jgi:alpha-glucosidase
MPSFPPKELPPKADLEVARSLGLGTLLASALYAIEGWFGQMWRWLRGKAPQPPWRSRTPPDEPLGDLVSYHARGQGLDLGCENGVLRLEILGPGVVRFRLRPAGTDDFVPVFSYALDVDAQRRASDFELEESPDALTVRTAALTCVVSRSPCHLTFLDPQGRPLSEACGGMGFSGSGAFCRRRLVEGEAIYGLGEKAFDLNLRGRRVELWNTDPHTYDPGVDPIHLSVPMLIGLRDGRAYGFFFDNPGRAWLDLGQERPERLDYRVGSGELCAYFLAGPGMADVLERYTWLTGRMPLPPRWMLGYHQSRWSYSPEERVRDLAAEFRSRRIPCDVLHLDIDYMDGYRVFTWDRERFSDPQRLLAYLRERGFRVIIIIDPGVKLDPGYHVHDEGMARDAFCKRPDGRHFRGPVWPGECTFPDFTDPEVRLWWGDLYRPLLEAGVAGFWNDMNEPAIFAGEMPPDVVHRYEGHGASHGEVHNIYSLQMARACAEGARRIQPSERVPVISRAGYAGLQRYALVWTGDNHSKWAHLRLSVSICLNLGLSGIAFCGPDTGGFAGDCDGELLARWTQVSALMPFFRNHSALGTAQQEPWAFGEPYESICRRWIELRYELLPYIYTAAWQASRSGLPMMRPLALAFPDDLRTYSLDDQFLLGDALLAAPVGRPGQHSRRVYLPGGDWYDFWTGERASGDVVADAPLDRMPLYVRAGAVLPMGPVMQHAGEWPPEALSLHVYPGDGESLLYEDDGHSMAYQDGEYRLVRLACETSHGVLTVHREAKGLFDPGYRRLDVYVHGLGEAPPHVLVDGAVTEMRFGAETGTGRLATGEWSRLEMEIT